MKRLIVGISGASGVIYGIRLLEVLKGISGVETHLILTAGAGITMKLETSHEPEQVEALADRVYSQGDLAAALSSGSFRTEGMIVAPCSMEEPLDDRFVAKRQSSRAGSGRDVEGTPETGAHSEGDPAAPRPPAGHDGSHGNGRDNTAARAVVYHQPQTIQDIIDQNGGQSSRPVRDRTSTVQSLGRRMTLDELERIVTSFMDSTHHDDACLLHRRRAMGCCCVLRPAETGPDFLFVARVAAFAGVCAQSRASAAIHGEYAVGKRIKGLQLEGHVQPITTSAARVRAIASYVKRHPFVREFSLRSASIGTQAAKKICQGRIVRFRRTRSFM